MVKVLFSLGILLVAHFIWAQYDNTSEFGDNPDLAGMVNDMEGNQFIIWYLLNSFQIYLGLIFLLY